MTGIGRASVLIGAGTVVSRLSGFVRQWIMVIALGGTLTAAGNAFAVANGLPNAIYAIVSTGLLAAVVVPQIVQAAAHEDGGTAFISKLFTLGTVALLVVTAIAMVCAPLLVQLYAQGFSAEQRALATAFAYWCLPQILFYGLYALVGEALNARNIYGPFTWAPIVNNIVSIAGFGLFLLLFGPLGDVVAWTPTTIALMGGTATVGIIVQALVLFLFWPKTGLRIRPDFRWRGMGLNRIGRLAGWTFLMVLLAQLAGIVQSRVLSEAAKGHAGVFAGQNAWLLYMIPYSLIVLSIGTPYFTRLSEHAAAGRHEEVRADIGRSIRTVGVFIVFATFALAAASIPTSRLFTDDARTAPVLALVLVAYLIGLVPNAVQFTIQRTFYMYNDTRTPFLFTIVQAGIVALTAWLSGLFIPIEYLAASVALGQSLAAIVQLVLATWLLRRKIGHLGTRSWMLGLTRFVIAGVPAAAVGWVVFLLSGGVGGWMTAGTGLAIVGSCVIGVVALVVYVALLALLRAPELRSALDTVRRVVRR
ncbi:murein biosynthesis integral membrane protein MurJ [Microbacterium horticulturae]|uniref:Murein biosynthesis integral membrane protein MurJ n=1 Tax=Microbacterium horticulturae TaxID=3028316 RepID=A0ABY8C2V8_9MICO|nr:murein biosynthesis integral membrane protein MurJ [Microbacterium sp. KACC 23027]WEG08958.1 murein biosynthesis integral membrane protein MurJ [Microbacterium sp. KACC 23027]